MFIIINLPLILNNTCSVYGRYSYKETATLTLLLLKIANTIILKLKKMKPD